MATHFLPDVTFSASYPDVKDCPTDSEGKVVVFTGRSNSGKSSLISAICNQKNLARVSATPGKTRLINYFKLGGSEFIEQSYQLVDLPGYGFAKMSLKQRNSLRQMVDSYLVGCKQIKLMVVVLDARRDLGVEENNIIQYCKKVKMPIILARTKWDKLNTKDKSKQKKNWQAHGVGKISYPVSSLKLNGMQVLINSILHHFNQDN